jgi:nucleotide-binding universal stress UspA family protein
VKKEESEDTQSVVEAWKKNFSSESVDFHTIESSDVEGIILKFIELHKVNLLAMHVHHRGFFERVFHVSLSKKLTFHSDIPIVALH